MALKKREDTANWKSKQQVALSGELAVEEATDLSQERLRNEMQLLRPLIESLPCRDMSADF
jgi:hypothetical protein